MITCPKCSHTFESEEAQSETLGKLLRTSEVRKRLSDVMSRPPGRETIIKMCTDHILEGRKVGTYWYVYEGSLEAWITSLDAPKAAAVAA
jgi:hypothetical protein